MGGGGPHATLERQWALAMGVIKTRQTSVQRSLRANSIAHKLAAPGTFQKNCMHDRDAHHRALEDYFDDFSLSPAYDQRWREWLQR